MGVWGVGHRGKRESAQCPISRDSNGLRGMMNPLTGHRRGGTKHTCKQGRGQVGLALKKGKPKSKKGPNSFHPHAISPYPIPLHAYCSNQKIEVIEFLSAQAISEQDCRKSHRSPRSPQHAARRAGEAAVTCSVPVVSLPIALDRHLLWDLFSFLGLSKAVPFVSKQEREHRK